MPVKLSGHARLKAALILRDALIADLGLPLSAAMRQLAAVEDTLGAQAALEEDRYLEALASLCRRDIERLASLHHALRAACLKAHLAPRYAQYLALLLFAHWLDARFSDPTALLARLNERLAAHPSPGVVLEPFTETDLQFAAFWMATASGKTHILHAALALLESRQHWDRILLITPSEALTRQHAEQLRGLRQWPVFAYPLDGDTSTLGHLPPDTVIVLDINKLAAEKKGDGVTIPTEVFQDGRKAIQLAVIVLVLFFLACDLEERLGITLGKIAAAQCLVTNGGAEALQKALAPFAKSGRTFRQRRLVGRQQQHHGHFRTCQFAAHHFLQADQSLAQIVRQAIAQQLGSIAEPGFGFETGTATAATK